MEAGYKRWVIAGKGELACHVAKTILAKNWELVVVPSIPHTAGLPNLKEWASHNGVPCKEDGQLDSSMRGAAFISIFYNKLLCLEEIQMFELCLNVHNSPLPAYRGVQSIRRALQNNECVHGITLHHIDKGVDTGRIIAQATYSIWPGLDSVGDVYDRANRYGAILLDSVFPLIGVVKDIKLNTGFSPSYYGSDRNHELVYKSNRES